MCDCYYNVPPFHSLVYLIDRGHSSERDPIIEAINNNILFIFAIGIALQ
jgi:hypothetical protein